MKRVFLIISFLALISCSENDGGPISVTRDDALLLVETLYGSYNTNIWISDRLIYESEILWSHEWDDGTEEVISPDYLSWLVVVDLAPLANWAHDCKYVFINARTMETEELIFDMLPMYVNITRIKTYMYEN